jgi:hypothetical protein
MTRLLIASAVIAAACAAGCAYQKDLYHWDSYEDDLYASYKNPERSKQYHETLRRIIQRSEERGWKTPPGIYAEYGYCLYVEGKLDEAIACFEKERSLWPESAVLMNTLIGNVARIKGDRDAVPPGGAVAEPAPAASED